MKRLLVLLLSLLLLFCILSRLFPEREEAGAEEDPASAEAAEGGTAEPIRDADISLRVLTEEGCRTYSMEEYLPLAVAAEMPASFESEALKAQAVALRSYVLYLREHPKSAHPQADVCTDPSCCAARADEASLRERWGSGYAAYAEKIRRSVADTDGQYLVWEDEPILAVFHASSLTRTEDAGAIWSPTPYLQSVETPETEGAVRNLITQVEVSAEDFRRSLENLYPAADFSAPPETWLGETLYTSGGRVSSVTVGGVPASGMTLRGAFSLRSTDFDLAWEAGHFLFTVRGYGHGVGMSQYGANLLARDGSSYAAILEHYYPGTELVTALRTGA